MSDPPTLRFVNPHLEAAESGLNLWKRTPSVKRQAQLEGRSWREELRRLAIYRRRLKQLGTKEGMSHLRRPL